MIFVGFGFEMIVVVVNIFVKFVFVDIIVILGG